MIIIDTENIYFVSVHYRFCSRIKWQTSCFWYWTIWLYLFFNCTLRNHKEKKANRLWGGHDKKSFLRLKILSQSAFILTFAMGKKLFLSIYQACDKVVMIGCHHSNLHGLLQDALNLFSWAVKNYVNFTSLFNFFQERSEIEKKT